MSANHWLLASIAALVLAAASMPQSDAVVAVRTFKFRPDTVVLRAGAAVAWTNDDDIEHTVTSDTSSRMHFDGPLRGKGATYRASFPKAGTYAYHCERHQFMRGVVRVDP